MSILRNFFNKKYFIKDFLKAYCLLCITLFFKTAIPSITLIDFFIIFIFFLCIINLLKIFIDLLVSLRSNNLLTYNIIFLSSLIVSLIRTNALYFARIIQSKPGLIWNVDVGFSLSHAQNVLKYGSLEKSISMSGFPEAYHIGPSYIAAVVSNYFKLSIDILSLLVLPTIFICTFIFAVRMIINTLVNDQKYELILSSLICFTPGFFLADPNLSTILNSNLIIKNLAYNLPYQFSTMQNSMMAGSAILCIFYFLITSIKDNLYLIISTSLSLYSVKPLYFISAFLFIFLFIAFILNFKNSSVLVKFRRDLKDLFRFKNVFLLIIIFSIWFFFYKFYLTPFFKASISLSFIKNLTVFDEFFLDNFNDLIKIFYKSIFDLPLIASLIFLILLVIKFNKGFKLRFKEVFFINFSIVLYLISTVVSFLSLLIPLSYSVLNAEGIILSQKMGISPNIHGEYLINETQASFPLFAIVTIVGISCISSVLKLNFLKQSSFFINFDKLLVFLLIIVNSIYTYFLVTKNNYIDTIYKGKGDEIDVSNYYKLIKGIPKENTLLLSNTVESGYYKRIFRNTYLTAFTTHDHFLANIFDYHWRRNSDGALNRLNIYYQIFPNNSELIGIYNPEAIDILIQNKISHLILKKVTFKKNNYSFRGLKFLRENDDWILFKVIDEK